MGDYSAFVLRVKDRDNILETEQSLKNHCDLREYFFNHDLGLIGGIIKTSYPEGGQADLSKIKNCDRFTVLSEIANGSIGDYISEG